MAGDFNLFFPKKLNAHGKNPALKKNFAAKLMVLKESFELRDLNLDLQNVNISFSFLQKRSSGFIQHKLD